MAPIPHRARESRSDRLARETHVNVLLAANRFSDGMDQVCREDGISQAQYVALWVLCLSDDAEAGVPMGSLADGLITRASDTTRLVDRLESAGLVERLPNPADRRGVLVRATAEGAAVFSRATPRLKAYHRSQWADLTADELEVLHGLLAKALLGDNAAARSATA